jgi:hypothetical protein
MRRAGSLEGEVKRFAARLRREHAQEIESDAKEFKHRACGLLKRCLPPFAGRPTEDSITVAAELRKQDRPWKEVYPVVIPNYATLDAPVRRQAESNLRSALRSRRNARKRRRRRKLIAKKRPRAFRTRCPKQAV